MEKELWEGRIIDYIDGKGSEEERVAVERELAQNEEFYTLYEQLREVMQAMDQAAALEPSSRLKGSFESALQKEIDANKKSKVIFFSPVLYRIAAGVVLLMAGVTIGYWVNKNNEQERQLAEMKLEMEKNRQVMLAMIDNQQSASQRMQGVSVAYELKEADDEVVTVLVKTMNEDGNTNVRLAALEALSKFSHEPGVRKALLQSMSSQKDPVVQIALIQIMVKLKEKGVVKELEKMTKDGSTMKAVKDEAYSGILKLS